MIKGIIFDLDGVLCHTDEYHYLAWKALADRLGIYFDREINNRLRGVDRMKSLEIILERGTAEYSEAEKISFAAEKNGLYRKMLEKMSSEDLSEEVRDTLNGLKEKNIKIAIGSSSKNACFILEKLGIINWFDVIVSGNDITKSKPDPQVYEKARQKLSLLPEECLVVEDAVSGVLAGKAAGMKVVGIGEAAACEFVDFPVKTIKEIELFL